MKRCSLTPNGGRVWHEGELWRVTGNGVAGFGDGAEMFYIIESGERSKSVSESDIHAENSKPRIAFIAWLGKWICYTGEGYGEGDSPERAYRDFLAL